MSRIPTGKRLKTEHVQQTTKQLFFLSSSSLQSSPSSSVVVFLFPTGGHSRIGIIPIRSSSVSHPSRCPQSPLSISAMSPTAFKSPSAGLAEPTSCNRKQCRVHNTPQHQKHNAKNTRQDASQGTAVEYVHHILYYRLRVRVMRERSREVL